jgi:hypothetical protein
MDKLDAHSEKGITARSVMSRFLKASVKTALICVVFHLLTSLMLPLESFSTYPTSLSGFFAVFLAFIFIIELTKGTIYQYIFSVANALFVVFYFAYVLNVGTIRLSVEQVVMTIDLSFFLAVLVLGGVIGFAKSLLQLLGWMNEREERGL